MSDQMLTAIEAQWADAPEGFKAYDISMETKRCYCWSDDKATYTIHEPQILYLKRDPEGHDDSHRVLDKFGVIHCPRRGWHAIQWETHKPFGPVQF